MKIIDISVSIDDKLPLWPGSPLLQSSKILSIDKGDDVNETKIDMSVHTGTHIDAPLHFIQNGKSANSLPLDIFIGKVFVADVSETKEITADDIKKLDMPKGTSRILFKTSNSKLWEDGVREFQKDYVGVGESAAVWLADNNIKLVGVDYLSVTKFGNAKELHKILLNKQIVLLEGINLSNVESGEYKLVCLPLKIKGIEASPTRAVLISM
ncbi:cyclase family protein [Candidatus Woesearchaeota archaeon]|jgi:arylformamidase|nr:cyclase family protein [Candidatus Woesearchaeota archaeon]MBT6048125.1 cyclase family protein [Candidatus Scalindua sp.]